jgi:drug/metabolite transporter (DMT)-like permease
MSTIPYILAAVFLSVIGQVFVKIGLLNLGDINISEGLISFYLKIFISPLVIIGTFIYTFSILFWLYGLTKVDLSFAYPFLALSYVLIILFSRFYLGESIPPLRWIGVSAICFGVLLISKS